MDAALYLGTGSENSSAAQQQGPGKAAVPQCDQHVPCTWDDAAVHPQDAFTTSLSYPRDLKFPIGKEACWMGVIAINALFYMSSGVGFLKKKPA